MPLSIQETIPLPSTDQSGLDIYEQGLIELASLFVAFDVLPPRNSNKPQIFDAIEGRLIQTQATLAAHTPRIANYDLVQHADYHITKHWMQILVWQNAMKQGCLSSAAKAETLTFTYPSTIAKQLLASITSTSGNHLASLGRDQVRDDLHLSTYQQGRIAHKLHV
jgi:hypothetical protein